MRRGGAIIKDIREASGANIKILPPEELPPCGLSNDRVVQCVPSLSLDMHALGRLPWLITPYLDTPRVVLCHSVVPQLAILCPCLSVQCAAQPTQFSPGGCYKERCSAASACLLACLQHQQRHRVFRG